MSDLQVQKLSSRIGATVTGVDFSAPPVAEIRAALNTHKALVFPEAKLDDAGQEQFLSRFGPLTSAHPTVSAVEGAPNVLPVDNERGKANQWHTDVTFVVSPPQITSLRSIVIPPYGGETLIASSAAAYQDLPAELKRFAETLWAVHSNDYDYAAEYAAADESRTEQERAHDEQFVSIKYETAHPVVRVHPLTGERGLYIGNFAQRLVGFSSSASRDILRLLQAYVTRPENVLRWRWSEDQLLIFDNRITQHYAIDNYDNQPRRLNRVTVAGDVPVAIDGSKSYSIVGDASHYTPELALA